MTWSWMDIKTPVIIIIIIIIIIIYLLYATYLHLWTWNNSYF